MWMKGKTKDEEGLTFSMFTVGSQSSDGIVEDNELTMSGRMGFCTCCG